MYWLWWGTYFCWRWSVTMELSSAHQDSFLSGERNVRWSFICILAYPSGKECSLGPASYSVIWAPITNADSQASPVNWAAFSQGLWLILCLFGLRHLSWRMLFDLLCHHQLTFWQGFVLGNTQDLWSGLYFIDLCIDWSCWGLLKFLKLLGSSLLERLTFISPLWSLMDQNGLFQFPFHPVILGWVWERLCCRVWLG